MTRITFIHPIRVDGLEIGHFEGKFVSDWDWMQNVGISIKGKTRIVIVPYSNIKYITR